MIGPLPCNPEPLGPLPYPEPLGSDIFVKNEQFGNLKSGKKKQQIKRKAAKAAKMLFCRFSAVCCRFFYYRFSDAFFKQKMSASDHRKHQHKAQ